MANKTPCSALLERCWKCAFSLVLQEFRAFRINSARCLASSRKTWMTYPSSSASSAAGSRSPCPWRCAVTSFGNAAVAVGEEAAAVSGATPEVTWAEAVISPGAITISAGVEGGVGVEIPVGAVAIQVEVVAISVEVVAIQVKAVAILEEEIVIDIE